MAKLARLMQAGPPQRIDPARFADKKERLFGELDVIELSRLDGLLQSKDGKISFELSFDRDEHRRVSISGGFTCILTMRCQRCLLPLNVNVEHSIDIVLIADEDEAKKLPRRQEGLLFTDKMLSLPALIEEELLLALPLAPLHENESCSANSTGKPGIIEERQHPFEVLKDFKTRNTKD